MDTLFEFLTANTTMAVVAVVGAVGAVVAACTGVYSELQHRAQVKADRKPDVQVTISDGPLLDWRYADFSVYKRLPDDVRLIGIRRRRPRGMRLWRLLDPGSPPEGGGAIQVDFNVRLGRGSGGQFYRILFKLPGSPNTDRNQKVSFKLLFVVEDTGEDLSTIGRGKIPPISKA